ncbi:50S ribosomal protein L21 [Buchnera aphidicola (Taiwanaphis decaspermi)]|uniref:50S ribosomal protein L21 n=1 Tax=Buchnera aphidicola TaxID=9 RepID=UPI0031B88C4B
MYAIFCFGGKQYQVKEGDIIKIEKLNYQIGESIIFKKILMFVKNKNINIGNPLLKNINIKAIINSHGKNKKIKIIKFKRRKHYKKTQGHRQNFTKVKIDKINFN